MGVRDSLLSIVPLATGEILVVGPEAHRKAVLAQTSMLGLGTCQAETADRTMLLASEKADVLDCVVLDFGASSADPWTMAKALRADPTTAAVPIVAALDAMPTEAELVRLLEAGVHDVVARLSPALLCAKVRAVCDRSRVQRELRSKLRAALENAAHDPLTGLYNRRYFERRLREESAHAKRHQRPFALLLVDIDHFKLVNDTYGHEDGDRVLVHLAELLRVQLREDDVPCRMGGEEFVMLLRATPGMAARVVGNRLRAALAASPIALGESDEPKHVTFSGGIAAADDRNGFSADEILGRADEALYRAKRAGRNRIEMEL